jgi:hypothetical protein
MAMKLEAVLNPRAACLVCCRIPFIASMKAFFSRGRIDQVIDLRHPLAVLGSRMPWQEI